MYTTTELKKNHHMKMKALRQQLSSFSKKMRADERLWDNRLDAVKRQLISEAAPVKKAPPIHTRIMSMLF